MSEIRATTTTPPTNSPDAPELVAAMLRDADQAGASDIHLQSIPGAVTLQWRLDGVLHDRGRIEMPVAERVLGRIKYLARLRTYQETLPQDGRIPAEDAGLDCDLRVSTYPTVTGEKIVLRIFRNSSAVSLAELGLPLPTLNALQSAIAQPTGLILLTGPAGSGKSTTVHAALHELAQAGGRHLVTVEDPVETLVPGVMQTEVNEARGLTYPAAVRHLLRQDPQAIVIGEIRDAETANLAVQAALTGHLVLSTLHAGSCHGVLDRLRLLVPDPFSVAASLTLVLNQRLVRRTCTRCQGDGCSHCVRTGFHGRIPIVEHLVFTDPDRPALRQGITPPLSPDSTLAAAASRAVAAGLTTSAEILRVLGK